MMQKIMHANLTTSSSIPFVDFLAFSVSHIPGYSFEPMIHNFGSPNYLEEDHGLSLNLNLNFVLPL